MATFAPGAWERFGAPATTWGHARLERDYVTLPRGEFTTNLAGAHLHYSFSPKMFLNTFFQYNNRTDSLSSNIRFPLIHRPLSDICVVY